MKKTKEKPKMSLKDLVKKLVLADVELFEEEANDCGEEGSRPVRAIQVTEKGERLFF